MYSVTTTDIILKVNLGQCARIKSKYFVISLHELPAPDRWRTRYVRAAMSTRVRTCLVCLLGRYSCDEGVTSAIT